MRDVKAQDLRPGDLILDVMGNIAWMCISLTPFGSNFDVVWWSFKGGKTIVDRTYERSHFLVL